ncbi:MULTISPECIES: hypothetical protein [unclassified Moorena]|nr:MULTISPECIES: hypothetical protein [unclassified Moorena]NEO16521.1 hypothetical protein [Moorena sp. SIO3E8]NEQ03033.1 hypothetical protein [Moorena sp. SIO3F7]
MSICPPYKSDWPMATLRDRTIPHSLFPIPDFCKKSIELKGYLIKK